MGAHFSVRFFFFILRAFSVSYTLVRKLIKGNVYILLERVNELLLNPFSPFDTKCKKLNLKQKTSGNVFFHNNIP